jgi:hypothetical protein
MTLGAVKHEMVIRNRVQTLRSTPAQVASWRRLQYIPDTETQFPDKIISRWTAIGSMQLLGSKSQHCKLTLTRPPLRWHVTFQLPACTNLFASNFSDLPSMYPCINPKPFMLNTVLARDKEKLVIVKST